MKEGVYMYYKVIESVQRLLQSLRLTALKSERNFGLA